MVSIRNQDDKKRVSYGKEVEELLAIASIDLNSNPISVIEDCVEILGYMGNKPGVYELMGKAYIKLKDYQKAENSFLTAIALGSNTKSNYFTLSKLVKCRADNNLSDKYLRIATTGSFREEIVMKPRPPKSSSYLKH